MSHAAFFVGGSLSRRRPSDCFETQRSHSAKYYTLAYSVNRVPIVRSTDRRHFAAQSTKQRHVFLRLARPHALSFQHQVSPRAGTHLVPLSPPVLFYAVLSGFWSSVSTECPTF